MAFKTGGPGLSQDGFEQRQVVKDRQNRLLNGRKSVSASITEYSVRFGDPQGAVGQSVIFDGHASTSPTRPPFSFFYESPPLADKARYELAERLAAVKPGQEVTFNGSWRQHQGSGWAMNTQRLATGKVDHDAFEVGSGNSQVLWHKGFDDRFLPKTADAGQEHAIGESTPVKQAASMYFAYNGQARPDLDAPSTFEAILDGERTSTTRYPEWGGIERWNKLQPGDLVRFFDDKAMKGRSVVVAVDAVRPINLSSCSPAELKDWSQAEGWSEDYGRGSGRRHGAGVQIRYHPVPGQAILEGRDAKCVSPEITPQETKGVYALPEEQRRSAFASSMARDLQR